MTVMHSMCAVKTLLGVNRKIISARKEPMLSDFNHFQLHASVVYKDRFVVFRTKEILEKL